MNNLLQKLLVGGSTSALLAALPATAVLAQGSDIEQVVVSASRVTIAGYSQPTPVSVVSSAQLERNAYSEITDAIRDLPQVVSNPSTFSTSQIGVAGGTVGANFINLRNLGASRTLVLFDSQRVVAAVIGNNGGAVDITTIPTSVVTRVDIVTGGASAAWGSDAVAGVANLVINKNLNGFKATATAGDTTDGKDRNAFLEAAWGGDIFGGRGHIEFAGNMNLKPDTVLATDEKWYRNSYWVSNPAYVAGNGQPQMIVANNVGAVVTTAGGIINSSPAGVAGPGVTVAAANALRGINFVGAGTPQITNYGNVTLNSLSNGGSLTTTDTYAPMATLASVTNTYSFFGYGRYKLSDTIQASVMLNFGYDAGKGASGPPTQNALTITSDNAYIPASVRSVMQSGGITSFVLGTLNSNNYNLQTATGANYYQNASNSLGPTFITGRRVLERGVFTLDGTIGNDWSWTAYAQESFMRYNAHVLSNPIAANLAAAEDAVTVTTANRGTSGLPLGSVACRTSLNGVAVVAGVITAQSGCIPLDVFGTQVASNAALGYITGAQAGTTDFAHEQTRQTVMEGSMQGTLPWQLPAGKVAVAFGAGYRKEAGSVQTTFIGSNGGYSNGNFVNYPSVSYNVIEGFAEVDAPILKYSIVNSLDVSAAGRMTSYSTSGLVETWKVGATSQINEDIKLRTTWSTDIRAPGLAELYNPGSIGKNNQRDPKSQNSVLTPMQTTGNANLLPETARTISGGVVLTPTFIPGLSFSADWYSINVTGEIATLQIPTILTQCNATLPSPINAGQNGNPNDPLCSFLEFNGPNGAISLIKLQPINIASQTTSGLDLQANYSMDFWDGMLSWAATANYNDEFTLTQPGSGTNDSAGSGGSPKWKGVLTATYDTGPYSVTAQAKWFGTSVFSSNGNTGNKANAATANLYDPAHFEIPFTAYLDLRGNYKWNENISFFGAIDNVLNLPPALVPNTTSGISISTGLLNTNPAYYGMLGRALRIGVRVNY